MKLRELTKVILIFTAIGIFGCNSDPRLNIQGVYKADKESLKTLINENLDSDNAFAAALLDKAIENAIIEVQISGDSLKGLMFIAGESNVFNTNIDVSNDSLVVKTPTSTFQLKPNENGIILQNINSDNGIQLKKSD